MNEPVMAVGRSRPPMLRRVALLASALSLLGSAVLSAPVMAVAASTSDVIYSVESAKASKTLMLDVVHAGQRLVAVGDRGHIVYSDDQGKSWTQAKVPTRQLLTAVFFVDDKHGWAVGHDAQILASDDGGSSWTKQFEDLTREAPLLDVWFKDASNGFAVGAYGALLETTDGGKHWEDASDRLENEDQFHLNAIAAVKDAGLFIVGEAGSMFRSADWGQTWERSKARTKARCSGSSVRPSLRRCWPMACAATFIVPLTSAALGIRSSSRPRAVPWSSACQAPRYWRTVPS